MPGSKEEDLERNNAFSLYELYGHAYHKSPCSFLHFGRPFFGHCCILSLSDPCLVEEKKIY